MASSSPLPPWYQIPEEILSLIIDRLGSAPADNRRKCRRFSISAILTHIRRRYNVLPPLNRCEFKHLCQARQRSLSADRARFRAVCLSSLLAVRRTCTPPRLLPWVVLSGGSFSDPSDCNHRRRLPTLPDNATCIGSTDDWLALDCADENNVHTYFLHNPLSDTTVPLPELNAVIGNVSGLFEVRKVLMRSGPHDVVAFLTNNCNYPFILVRPGKGVWMPEPRRAPFVYIMDIAFLGEKLYGITHTKDLVSFSFDIDGIPNVTSIERLIRPLPSRIYGHHVWRDDDDDDNSEAKSNDKGYTDEFEFEYNDEEVLTQEENQEECSLDELREKTGDDRVLDGIIYLKDTKVPYVPHDIIEVIWYLVESRGKLLMLRRHLQVPTHIRKNYTRKVEVFEARATKGDWVPISHGLCGQALFISKRFSKSISAYGDVEEDTIYFADTGEIFDIKSQTMSPTKMAVNHWQAMWMFSPDLVV